MLSIAIIKRCNPSKKVASIIHVLKQILISQIIETIALKSFRMLLRIPDEIHDLFPFIEIRKSSRVLIEFKLQPLESRSVCFFRSFLDLEVDQAMEKLILAILLKQAAHFIRRI